MVTPYNPHKAGKKECQGFVPKLLEFIKLGNGDIVGSTLMNRRRMRKKCEKKKGPESFSIKGRLRSKMGAPKKMNSRNKPVRSMK